MANTAKRRSPLAIFLALIVIAVVIWGLQTFVQGSVTPKTILLMGMDEGNTRTDVLVVAHVDPTLKVVNLISIPRDTLVNIPCDRIETYCLTPDKVNHAHAYAGENGTAITKATVEKFLGVKIDHYAKIDYEGFEKVIDALEGVDIVIEQDMHYEDPYAKPPLEIHFTASEEPQHLDGADALRFVRFRADGLGDLGRIERTKTFAHALYTTLKRNGSLLKLPGLVATMLPYVETDVDAATAVALARAGAKIEETGIQTATVEGTDGTSEHGAWVWLADEAKLVDLVDRMIRNPQPTVAESKTE